MQPALFGKRVKGERREGEARGEVCGCMAARERAGGAMGGAEGAVTYFDAPKKLTKSRCQRYSSTTVMKLFL
jgi:hypothetical protein